MIHYVFIELADHGVHAVFWRRSTGFLGLLEVLARSITGRFDRKEFSEEDCKEFYEDACRSDFQSFHTPTANSKDDLKRAFHSIRAYKRQRGIPLDTGGLT